MKGRDIGFLQRVAPALLAVALTACGGGGGSDEPGPAGGGNNSGGGGGQVADITPDAFSFSPASVDNADAGGTYFATATVTGFDTPLPARITGVEGNATAHLVVEEEAVGESTIAPGDTLTLRVILDDASNIGDTASATVAVGEGANARTATFSMTVTDNTPPAFSIDFPPPKSVTQAETVTLVGRYTENHLPGSIRAFRQDGSAIEGILRDDGYWQMVVDLEVGPNVFSMEMTDSVGLRSAVQGVEIFRDADLFASDPLQMAYDQVSNDVFVLSGSDINRIDLDTRQRTVVASETVGMGEPILPRRMLAVPGQELLVVEDTGDCARDDCKLVRIDLATLERSVLASGIGVIRAMTLTDEADVLVAGNFPDDPAELGIVAIGIDTGEQRLISRGGENGRGSGDGFSDSLSAVAFDTLNDLVYAVERGFGADGLRRLVLVPLSNGNRTTLSANRSTSNVFGSGTFMDDPVALSVDRGNGAIYVLDGGVALNTPAAERPLIRILLQDGSRTVVSSNIGHETTALSDPIGMAAIRGDNGGLSGLLIADRDRIDGLVHIDIDSFERAIVPGNREIGGGADFDAPFALELDARNDRLLVLSPQSVQTVGINDGVRSEKLLDTEPDAIYLGGMALVEDELWLTTNTYFFGSLFGSGLGSVDIDSLALGNALLDQRFLETNGTFGETGALIVEDRTALVSSRDGDNVFLKKVAFAEDGTAEVMDFVDSLAAGPDSAPLGLFRFGPEQIIRAAAGDFHVADPRAENDVILPGVAINDANGYAYDSTRQYLYGVGDFGEDTVCFELARIDFSRGADMVEMTEILAENIGGDCATTTSTLPVPGADVNVTDLFGLAMDAERNRLYALLDRGRNVVAINVAEVLLNEQGLPARAGDATSGETAPLGEAVLISRSENPGSD